MTKDEIVKEIHRLEDQITDAQIRQIGLTQELAILRNEKLFTRTSTYMVTVEDYYIGKNEIDAERNGTSVFDIIDWGDSEDLGELEEWNG